MSPAPASPRAHRSLLLLGSLVLSSALGCALLRSERSVVDDVQAHLESTYGEAFVVSDVTQARGVYGEPTPLKDVHRFEAHPVDDPGLAFSGTVDYRSDGTRVREDYRCVRVRSWLPGVLEQRLGDRRRLVEVDLACEATRTPARSTPGEPLPEGAVRLMGQLHSFEQGDPQAVIDGAKADLLAEATTLGVEVKGLVVAVAPEAWSVAKGWRESGPALETAEDWEALIRAREDLGGHPPFTRWDRVPAVEDRASAAVRQAHPDARVAVWARPDKMTGRHRIDVRVARPDLTLSDAEALVTALEPVLRPDFWSLTVLDKAGPDDPQYAAFVCRKYTHPCARSDWPLIDPSALQRSGALEGE